MTKPDRNIGPILAVLVVALAPHVARLPIWVILWCLAMWGWTLASEYRPLPRPNRLIRVLLAVTGIWVAMADYGYITGRDVGVAMLAVMLGLKPLEIESHRDRMITLFLAYFLILTNLFYSQSLFMAAYLFAAVIASTAVLIHLHQADRGIGHVLQLAGRLTVQALPLVALFFILFPRLPGGLFRLPDTSVAMTGLSDVMAPGDITRLVRSREPAFRVEFNGPIPEPSRLYWRGVVLWTYDGEAWRREYRFPVRNTPLHGDRPVNYTLTIEPHKERWVYALDMPGIPPPRTIIRQDYMMVSLLPLDRRRQFNLTSYIDYRTAQPSTGEARLATVLPAWGNDRSRSLARKWAAESRSPEEIVQKGLSYFRAEPFYYTLNPPPLGEERVDDFLFRTRRGYCEHYASAFVFLMRAAGVPARVVLGYQGGEINPLGNYLIVRQSDAHAWAEVALPDRGWVRVDPTAAVAPQRVEQGMEASVPAEELAGLFTPRGLGPLYKYWIKARLRWDRADFLWGKWVMDYNHNRQRGLLALLGIHTRSFMGTVRVLVVVLVLSALAAFLIAWRFSRSSVFGKKDRVDAAYRRFCRKMARRGLPRGPAEGPMDYADRLAKKRPDAAAEIRAVTGLYVKLRYGPGGDRRDRVQLDRMVRGFRA